MNGAAVLIIDDEENLRKLLARIIELEGYASIRRQLNRHSRFWKENSFTSSYSKETVTPQSLAGLIEPVIQFIQAKGFFNNHFSQVGTWVFFQVEYEPVCASGKGGKHPLFLDDPRNNIHFS